VFARVHGVASMNHLMLKNERDGRGEASLFQNRAAQPEVLP
jgi:hypothetical protein